MIKRLTSNARKPGGLWGRLMIRKMNAGHFNMTVWALKKIKLPEHGVIADIGCGGGSCIKLLSSMSKAKIIGIDYSELCVKKSIKKNKRAVKNGQAEVIKADVIRLPFKNASIDCAVSVESVYFWKEPDKSFSEIKRTLKPGASFNIICEMVKNEDGTGAHTEIAEFLKLNYYSITELETLLRRNGFKSIDIQFEKSKGWLLISGIA